RNFDEVEKALRAKGYLDSVVKAAWPLVSPDKLVHSLLSSRAALAEAADGILDDDEQKLLFRRGAAWSDGDIPLLDEARTLLDTLAPGVTPPISYRTGADPPVVRRVQAEHLLAEAFRTAEAAPDGLLAVIVPEELVDQVPDDELVPVLTPRQSKGLEFDHVI